MDDLISRQKTESIPYEEYRLTFERAMHTLDGKIIRVGLPIQCNMCILSSDKQLIAMDIDRLFEKMREAVKREVQNDEVGS